VKGQAHVTIAIVPTLGEVGAIVAPRGAASALRPCGVPFEIVVACVPDFDGSPDPAILPRLVAPVLDGSVDVAARSRCVPGEGTSAWPRVRRLLSALATARARFFTGARDSKAGLIARSRELLLDFAARVRGYKILFELLVRSPLRTRVVELPLRFIGSKVGSSEVGPRLVRVYCVEHLSFTLTPHVWRTRSRPSVQP
jgi:hypothetical protein